ncbi:recombination protein NinB [Sphingomicrobium sp. XHP0235]|uniref:recombination protein NinB n=1 Tax=Sphingomicrobium aquimarinum TaxID=3133971 RepID=UPI0031FEDA9D
MTGHTIILSTPSNRERAKRLIDSAPDGVVANFRKATRTTDQNARMWAMLGDISRAKPEGRELAPEVWKALFMHSLGHQVRFEHGLDGEGMVPIGFRSSRLTKQQMSDLMELIAEYAARHEVSLQDEAA